MHIGAGGIGGIYSVADLREHQGAVVDLLRIGGIRRVQLGGDGELPLPQHTLQPPTGAVAGQRRQRIGRIDVALRRHGTLGVAEGLSASGFLAGALPGGALPGGGAGGSVLSRTTLSQEEWSFRRLSTGFCTSRMATPFAMCREPSQ